MSSRSLASALGNDRSRSRSIVRTTARVVLSLGLVASVGVVLPASGLATASASAVPAGHHGPGGGGGNQGGPGGRGNPGGGNQGGGGGGFGGGGFRHIVIVSGTVGSVGTTSFTLTRGFGPIMPVPLTGTATTGTTTGLTVDVSQQTRFLVQGTTSPNLSDVMLGDKVTITGRRAGSGIVNANLVVIPLELVTGAVGTVGTDSFTIPLRPMWSLTSTATTLTGTATAWTIDVSGTTTYHERGVSSSTLSLTSLASGDHVTVVGSQAGALTLDAITLLIEPPRGTGGGSGGGGGPGGGHHHPK
jgi:hypothetical protein